MGKSCCPEEIFMNTVMLEIELSLVSLFSQKELEESAIYWPQKI